MIKTIKDFTFTCNTKKTDTKYQHYGYLYYKDYLLTPLTYVHHITPNNNYDYKQIMLELLETYDKKQYNELKEIITKGVI